MLPEYIQAIMRCPACNRGSLFFSPSDYSCLECGSKFQIRENIPDFIIFSNESNSQSIEAKKGEIEFRTKLIEQEVLNTAIHFRGMPNDLDHLMEKWIQPQIEDLEWILQRLSIAKEQMILEIGCEYGYCTSHLYNKGYRVTGGDLSHHCLITAPPVINRKFGYAEPPPLMSFDALNLPFSDSSIDFAFSFAFVHHFPTLQKLSKEIARVLKPGGYYAFGWEPIVPAGIFGKRRRVNAEDLHELSYNIHEGLYTFPQYYRGFRKEFKLVTANPWNRWKKNKNPSSFKRVKCLFRSIIAPADGFGMILRKKAK